MKVLLIILSFYPLILSGQNRYFDPVVKNDSAIVDSKYIRGTWSTYFQTVKTPLGAIFRLKIITDSTYVIQWGDSLSLKTFPVAFYLDGHETWIPKFIDENKDYIVMRQGCGNPCWIGYFLPLDDSIKPGMFHEYLDYDLNNNLIVYVKSSKIIGITNIKTDQIEDHKIEGCTSVFLGYCIDSLTIKNRILKFKWISDTIKNSQKGDFKTEKIKI